MLCEGWTHSSGETLTFRESKGHWGRKSSNAPPNSARGWRVITRPLRNSGSVSTISAPQKPASSTWRQSTKRCALAGSMGCARAWMRPHIGCALRRAKREATGARWIFGAQKSWWSWGGWLLRDGWRSRTGQRRNRIRTKCVRRNSKLLRKNALRKTNAHGSSFGRRRLGTSGPRLTGWWARKRKKRGRSGWRPWSPIPRQAGG